MKKKSLLSAYVKGACHKLDLLIGSLAGICLLSSLLLMSLAIVFIICVENKKALVVDITYINWGKRNIISLRISSSKQFHTFEIFINVISYEKRHVV